MAGTLTTNKVNTKKVVVETTSYGRISVIRSSTSVTSQELPPTKKSPGNPRKPPGSLREAGRSILLSSRSGLDRSSLISSRSSLD